MVSQQKKAPVIKPASCTGSFGDSEHVMRKYVDGWAWWFSDRLACCSWCLCVGLFSLTAQSINKHWEERRIEERRPLTRTCCCQWPVLRVTKWLIWTPMLYMWARFDKENNSSPLKLYFWAFSYGCEAWMDLLNFRWDSVSLRGMTIRKRSQQSRPTIWYGDQWCSCGNIYKAIINITKDSS